jgi:large subunit ribosomal protein L3
VTVGLIGRKLGMTRLFAEDGSVVPVSVIAAAPNTVTAIRSVERDGYAAVQLGAGSARRVTKPVAGQLPPLDKDAPRPSVRREFRVDTTDGYEPGQALDVTLFEPGDKVDVTGTSKGRGFAGTVKRHHFHRGPVTHGSTNTRQPGSIGAGTTPGRVFKGTRMSGHMGNRQVTVLKLEVVKVDAERALLLVRGAIPGARNSLVVIRKAEA